MRLSRKQYTESIRRMLETLDDSDIRLIDFLVERFVTGPEREIEPEYDLKACEADHGFGDWPEDAGGGCQEHADSSDASADTTAEAEDWPRQGIFWIEIVPWGPGQRERTTVAHAFQYLESIEGIPQLGRNVENRDQFLAAIAEWMSIYSHIFPILYLAFHGDAGQLIVGDYFDQDNWFSLRQLEEHFGPNGAGGLLYFASCGTVGVERERLQEFLEATGFAAVCGYRGSPPWMDSAVFDLMMLSKLAALPGLDGPRLRSANALVKGTCSGLYGDLRFRMVVRE